MYMPLHFYLSAFSSRSRRVTQQRTTPTIQNTPTTRRRKEAAPLLRGHEINGRRTMSETGKIDDEVVILAADEESSPSDINNDGLDIDALDGKGETNDPTELKGIIYHNPPYVGPDLDLEGWFNRHTLPYTDGVKISLDDWGVQCVEQLKLLPSDAFLGMYDPEKLVVRETAVSQKIQGHYFCFVTQKNYS